MRSPRIIITTAQTTVSAASGQTIVIGGLITDSKSTISRRIPWLSDVPVVGNLFRYDGNTNSRKELLIILTPHVVRGPSEAEYIKQVEMARMSWISCDIFNWMNTDSNVTGQLDSGSIPTIYPDQTPGADSFQQVVPSPPVPDTAPNGTINNQGGIQQMSFSSVSEDQTASRGVKPPEELSGMARKSETVGSIGGRNSESEANSKQNPKTKQKSKWSLR